MSANWLEGFTEPVPSISGLRLAMGERIPTGWGIAWRCEDRDLYVAFPIPLNILARGVRNLYHRAIVGWVGESVIDAAWARGHHVARRRLREMTWRAYQAGLTDGEYRTLRMLRDRL